METFGLYLLKSSVWLTGFALVYFLFLQDERFFFIKRYYLITGIAASILFPLITFHYQVDLPAQVINSSGMLSEDSGMVTSGMEQLNPGNQFYFSRLILFLYLSGVLFFAFKFVLHIVKLIITINRTGFNFRERARLIRTSEFTSSFSFFNYVFINPSINETELEEIMNHELVHVSQKHWFDLLLVEMLRLFQWVNPFVWIYTRFIRVNHEYIADEVALQRTSDPAVYKAVLVNQLFDSRVIRLSNSFNYSLNKKRFDMMKTIITSPYRKLKVLLVVPVLAIIFYAFSTPEYRYTTPSGNMTSINVAESAESIEVSDINSLNVPSETQNTVSQSQASQKTVKGIVLKEDGSPLEGAFVMSTGTAGNTNAATTAKDGRFEVNILEDASLLVLCTGYKQQTLKPVFTSDMTVKLTRDPEYKGNTGTGGGAQFVQRKNPVVVIDGVISDKTYPEAVKELGYDLGIVKSLLPGEAADKYGEKGKDGALEITTRKKALAMGLKPPFRRLNPDDYPTFQGKRFSEFKSWVLDNTKYPAEAQAKGIEGWVFMTYTVELDGSISNIKFTNTSNPVLGQEVARVIGSSPGWEPAKNPAVDEPFTSVIDFKFALPDKIVVEAPFVVVEQMPEYPGGDVELLKFIASNTNYPADAKAKRIEGRVIIRFFITTEGNVDGISVLKGVDPLLDTEAVRVIRMLTGFRPGMQGGKAVPVWYMVPVNFALAPAEQPGQH